MLKVKKGKAGINTYAKDKLVIDIKDPKVITQEDYMLS